MPTHLNPSRMPWLSALLAVVLVFATEQMIEHYAQRSELEQEKIAVHETLSTQRARLEGVLNSNLLLVRGLTAVISAQPDIDQAGFARIARSLIDERSALRNIAGAPDMVISLMYPLDGNEAAIGLDYRTHPIQREAALRAMRSGQPVVAGPLTLVQGGLGLVMREAVFVPPEQPGGKLRFWGLVSAVIDIETLYRHAGLDVVNPKLRLAIRGTDGAGVDGPVFFGDADVFLSDPVTRMISLPGGAWQMAAVPVDGWGAQSRSIWLIRLLGVLAALIAGTLAYLLVRGSGALAASEARLRALLDTIPDMVWLKDPAGVYLAGNPRLHAFFGSGPDGILGKTDADLLPADVAEAFRAHDLAAINAGKSSVSEECLTYSDGHRELAETIRTPVRDSANNLIGLLGIARDITQRKQAEAELLRQRDILDRTSRLAKVGGWSFNVADMSGFWTEEAARIHDLEADAEIDFERGLAFYPGTSRTLLEQAIQSAIADGTPYDLELNMISAKGAEKWVRTIGLTVKEDGRVIRVEGAIQDISAWKSAETRAKHGEALLDSVFEALPDLLFLLDDDGVILDYRASKHSELYVPPQAFLGKRMRDVLPDDLGEQFDQNKARVRRDGGLVSYEYDLSLPHGLRHFEARLSRLPDSTQIIAVVRDITERTRMEEEIRHINTELEARVRQRTAELAAANKELETFTYSVSHDLKAPLRGIDGYSRLLLEDHQAQLDDEGRFFLANVRHGVDQMSQLIEDLLAYSRMERRNLHGIELDLRDQVEAVLKERGEEIETKGVRVELDLDATSVRADPEGLAMVLRNLIDNALKFSRESHPPTISISGVLKGKTVILAVKDNGIGFDMQFQDRIFEIFQRLQRSEDYPGTGVGLAIVRKAMQRMGGRVWAKSEPGRGATFYLELPR